MRYILSVIVVGLVIFSGLVMAQEKDKTDGPLGGPDGFSNTAEVNKGVSDSVNPRGLAGWQLAADSRSNQHQNVIAGYVYFRQLNARYYLRSKLDVSWAVSPDKKSVLITYAQTAQQEKWAKNAAGVWAFLHLSMHTSTSSSMRVTVDNNGTVRWKSSNSAFESEAHDFNEKVVSAMAVRHPISMTPISGTVGQMGIDAGAAYELAPTGFFDVDVKFDGDRLSTITGGSLTHIHDSVAINIQILKIDEVAAPE